MNIIYKIVEGGVNENLGLQIGNPKKNRSRSGNETRGTYSKPNISACGVTDIIVR